MNRNTDGAIDPKINKTKRTVRGKIITAILCLLAAFALWLYVMQTESPTYTDTIDGIEITLENAAEGLSVYNGQGQTVSVEISGKKSLIDRISASDVKATVDLENIAPGNSKLPVSVSLPSGLTLVKTVPDEITVFVDKTVSKTVPVKEKMDGLDLPLSYKVGAITYEYDTVTVSGPAKKVEGIAEAQVTIDMSNKTSSFYAICPITLLDGKGASVTMDNLTCTPKDMTMNVTVPIYLTAKLQIPVEFREGLLNTSSAKVTLTPSVISVTGDEKDIKADGAVSPIVIDEKAINESPWTFTVTPAVADGITVDPGYEEITVTVELDTSLTTKQFNVETFRFTGTALTAEYEAVEKSIAVTLRGPSDLLEKLDDDDVYLSVDMTGYDSGNAGTVTRPAAVVIKGAPENGVFEIGSYSVSVKIS